MRLGTQIGTDEKYVMTSWRSPTDPSIGSFSAGVDPSNIPQVFVWNGSYPHWRSGPWNGQIFIGIPNMETVYNNGFNFVDDKGGSTYLTFTYANESTITYFSLNSGGTLVQKYWNDGKQDWQVTWSAPRNDCDLYGKCGLFGRCHLSGSPICTCLKGFAPKSLEEWNRGNWTSGCVRKMNLQCDRNNTEGKEDGFLKLTNMKVPDFGVWSNAPEGECGSQCFHNCSCIAYAYYSGIGCMHWTHGLIDIHKFSGHTGATLYLRVAYTELDKKKSMKVFIVIAVILGSTAIAICAYFFWMWIRRKRVVIWPPNMQWEGDFQKNQMFSASEYCYWRLILWQSFEHPSDSYLQKMRLGAKVGTDEKYVMTSWKSPSDPSTGSFSAGVDPLNIAQVFVWNGSDPYWRSGPWNGQFFIGIPNLEKAYNNGFNFVDDKEGSAYLTFTYANESIITYFSLNSEGTLAQMYWNEGKQNWQVRWSAPRNDCEHYGKCGPFGSCYLSNSPICTCLKGFEPKIPEEWNRGNWTSGCVRRLPLQCDRNNTEGKEDGFFKLTNMKVPDFGSWSNAPEGECGSQCFHNCSCIAYAYHAGIGCMQWSHILVDIEKFSNRTGATLYVRVAYSELATKEVTSLLGLAQMDKKKIIPKV
ncbi:hypothetical protein RJ639_009079 [Escallonia herrerae]|uniref:non-specific serine/threonine protein kinase n=1 Tax=Escallonia herrerae TaxID=1293975 RepID=A0AA89AT94_9ASTE|nr:hypothetical protein RJ639_009079 [Escallonia herrerae]